MISRLGKDGLFLVHSSSGHILCLDPLALCRRRALDEVNLDKHAIGQIDGLGLFPLQHEAPPGESCDKGTDIGLASPVLEPVDFDGEVLAVESGLLGVARRPGLFAAAGGSGSASNRVFVVVGRLSAMAHAVVHNGGGGGLRGRREPGLDLGDPQLAFPVENAVGLFDEIHPVRAHEGEAENSNVDGTVGERQIRNVGFGHEWVGALQIEALDVHLELGAVLLQRLRQARVTTTQVGNGAGPHGARERARRVLLLLLLLLPRSGR